MDLPNGSWMRGRSEKLVGLPALREARRYLRLSQTSVAEFVGTTRQAVAAFEKGSRQPDLAALVCMANLYRLTLDELVGGARSAVSPAASTATRHLPRSNRGKPLDAEDAWELRDFEQYLAGRTRSAGTIDFEVRPLETITETVVRLLEALGFTGAIPVPVLALAARLGIEVRFTALAQLAGALIIPEGASPPGVLVNSDQPFERQRFSAAHELGHWVLKHETSGVSWSHLGRRFDPQEVDADSFASELLIPAHHLREALRDAATDPHRSVGETVLRLARRFAVSFQAMGTRLSKLGALRPDQVAELEAVKPRTLEAELGLAASPGTPFDEAWLEEIAAASMPPDWSAKASPETVRTLQECAYIAYLTRVPEGSATDPAAAVYSKVARWVARGFPVVGTVGAQTR